MSAMTEIDHALLFCRATTRIVDEVPAADLVRGKRWMKQRHVCAVGHSYWTQIEIPPLAERPLVGRERLRPGARLATTP